MRKLVAVIGFLKVVIGTYCPLLRPFGLFSWNIYGLNKPYGLVVLAVAVAGVIGINQRIRKAISWTTLALILILYAGALLKVNTSFSFIPFKNISAGLSGLIKFKWGWLVLFGGALLAVYGSSGGIKSPVSNR